MSTGLLIFLVFVALSVLDSVARARRGRRQAALPPGEDGERPEAEDAPPVRSQGKGAGERASGGEAMADLLGLEKLMGPGYLEKLMGPAVAVAAEEEEVPEKPEADAAASAPDGGRASSLERDERREIARTRRTSDQERRRAEAKRPPRAGRSEAEERRSRGGRDVPADGRRPPEREAAASLRAGADRAATPLRDSFDDGGERPRRAAAPAAAGFARQPPRRTRSFRDLFGSGDPSALRRAFVLREVLDAPVSEREGRRDAR